MYAQQFFVEGLGCSSYLVGCEAYGVAAVIDPDREVNKYIEAARGRGLQITHVIETHLHADHVSGNTDLAERTGADIYLHELAQAEFSHRPLKDGDTLMLGNVRLDVRHTPGHTPESISLLVTDTTRAQEPWMVMTGDTLFVGDIGRPDLVGADKARDLAKSMYKSLFNGLLTLDDHLLIYPGHGAGSLCGKSIGSMRSTTLGYERKFNPALSERSQEEFIEFATSNLPEQPGNHQRIKTMNRQGPKALGEVKARPLSIEKAIEYFQRGAAMLDTRAKQITSPNTFRELSIYLPTTTRSATVSVSFYLLTCQLFWWWMTSKFMSRSSTAWRGGIRTIRDGLSEAGAASLGRVWPPADQRRYSGYHTARSKRSIDKREWQPSCCTGCT